MTVYRSRRRHSSRSVHGHIKRSETTSEQCFAGQLNRVIEIESEGPIKVLGDKHQALVGGQLSLFVFSRQESGKAKITLRMDDIQKVIDLEVK